MSGVRHEHVHRTSHFDLPMDPRQALQLFTPEGERSWARDWDPRYVHPADGELREGMVFTTAHGGEETVWMLLRHAPEAARVEYLRLTPGSRVGIVRVACDPLGQGTRVTVGYELTALSESGNAAIRALDEAAYATYIASWPEAIGRALSSRGSP